MGGSANKGKRVQVVFTPEQWELMEMLRGQFGSSDSDIVRSVALAWLAEKSLISTQAKQNMKLRDEKGDQR